MAYDFKDLQEKVKGVEEWLQGEYFGIRTGRATPAVLDSIKIDSYGAMVPLNQAATITIEDARTLRVLPYDVSQAKEIEKAITNSSLGLSVTVDDKGARVMFPELTSENREALKKVVREKLEQARISLRTERDHVWSAMQKEEKDGDISEDEKFTYKEEMEKIIADATSSLEAVAEAKETELAN